MEANSNASRDAGMLPEAARLLAHARQALARGQIVPAEQMLARVLALHPDCAEAHRLMGIALLIAGDSRRAISHLQHALTANPGDSTLNMNLGSALFETGDAETGLAYLQRACELASESASTWYNYGKALQVCAYMERARAAFERALALEPGYTKARTSMAEVLSSLGDIRAAATIYRQTVREQPDCAEAWFGLANMKTESFDSADVAVIASQFGRKDLPDGTRIVLGFTLAWAMEDQGNYAGAFDILSEANALKRRYVRWSREEEQARVEAIHAAFAGTMPVPLDPSLGQDVIFVVCMPRSGSTLTEQILASHPQVESADEIEALPQVLDEESARRGQPFPAWVPAATAEDWRRLGETYLERTRRWQKPGHRFTDKNPSNWAFVGAALAMLPGARVVNSRRDPLETCLACYRQLFGNRTVSYSYDLDDLVSYYAGYERLSRFWRERFPARYFDHAYEALQADMEGQIRRLLSFCGLAFDEACMDFHRSRRTVLTISAAQVRQPLRRDTARVTRYGDRLDPLKARLRAAGLLPEDHTTA